MSDGCQGCGQADVTLRQGIEGLLTQFVPEVTGVLDITNHSAGANRSGGIAEITPNVMDPARSELGLEGM
jgi:hypothetical protein